MVHGKVHQMTAQEILIQLQDLVDKFPECGNREVKMLTMHGRMEIEEICISVTSNVWLIQK
jgi:hypothetical protein